VIPATWEAEIRRIVVRGQPGQMVCRTPISKITIPKWTEGMAQVVELLFCECRALSSKPGPTKKKKKKKELLMTSTVLVSITGHMVILGVYNALLYPFCIPCTFASSSAGLGSLLER
jgi:hypothetical protein